ncbi:MAG: UDP binding domain-containing protein [Pirellulaceae bacterium]
MPPIGAGRCHERLSKRRFATNIVKTLFNTVSDKKIAIWGWAFKKDTNDTRESAAIYVCRDLLRERARLHIYDPRVKKDQIVADLEYAMQDSSGQVTPGDRTLIDSNVSIASDSYEAAKDAHAIAVMTEWDEFKTLDFQRIYQSMPQPAFIFDGRNILDRRQLAKIGFGSHAIGKPA